MIPAPVSTLWWARDMRRRGRACDELAEFPQLSPEAQRKELASRLLAQVQYFGKREDALPEWREATRITDPDELWKIWPTLPIMTKRDLQTRFVPKDIQSRFHIEGRIDATGGSTGEPTPFLHDPAMQRSTATTLYYTRMKMGWKPGMATIIIWGAERDIGKNTPWKVRLGYQLLRDFMVDGYRLTSETTDRVLEILRSEKRAVMYGFTSMLEFIAQDILDRGLNVPPGALVAAWNGGEALFDQQSDTFRRAFGIPIFNRYGGRELGVMACQFAAGAPISVLRPWLFVEAVDDQGKPVPPGEPGRLIWTSTINRGTPFLRYDVEDLGSFAPEHYKEAGLTAIDQLQGRVAGVWKLADGRTINNLYWNHLMKEFTEVKQFQVVIKKDNSLQILLKGSQFGPEREAHLRRVLEGFLGPVPVTVSCVDKIPLTRLGKLIQVVKEK